MLVIGHRGASAVAPENAPEAFELADRMGADGVELDVRLAPAGDRPGDPRRLLVHHDPLPVDPVELAALPSFDEVLDACGDRMLVNVEIKYDWWSPVAPPPIDVVTATLATLRRRGPGWTDRWLVSSFSRRVVTRSRSLAPDVRTALLVDALEADAIDLAVSAGHSAVHPDEQFLVEEDVERCHRIGLRVNVWTCNDPARMEELASWGVDGMCTDVPDLALDRLGRSRLAAPSWSG